MPKFNRLIRIGTLAKEQALAVTELMTEEGLCTCGRFLNKTDAKFCLGQVNTISFRDPRGRNTLVIAAYCYECFSAINNLLKMLKDRHIVNEPDRMRHEGKSE